MTSFQLRKFGHEDLRILALKRPQHLKYDVALVIIDVPMTTLGRPLVSRVVHAD